MLSSSIGIYASHALQPSGDGPRYEAESGLIQRLAAQLISCPAKRCGPGLAPLTILRFREYLARINAWEQRRINRA